MWFLYPQTRSADGPDLRARARQRERDRERPASSPLPAIHPRFEPPDKPDVVELGLDRAKHLGRRLDRRSDERITRPEREQAVLRMLGVFRVASRASIADSCFDGHPFAANRVLGALVSKGLVKKKHVAHGKRGYQVYVLAGAGRDQLALDRLRLDQDDSVAGSQRYWSDTGDERQLRHDQHVYDAVCADVEPVLRKGGRVVRVRLESELRGHLAVADYQGRRAGTGPEGPPGRSTGPEQLRFDTAPDESVDLSTELGQLHPCRVRIGR